VRVCGNLTALAARGWRMIRLEDVSKRFGNATALREFTLTVPHGQTAVLIGPSGCGKSTLIRIVAGLVTPDAGRVIIEDELLTHANLLQLRRRMGYVIQQGGLFPPLTVKENVAVMAGYLHWPKADVHSRILRLAELTGLPAGVMERYPLQLSGGQSQRVSLMRALMLDPGILLLDEPLAALDPLTRFELQRDLRDIFRTLRKTVVLVTHDLAEAAYFGEWVVLMKDGSIMQQGTIADMIGKPADPFVTHFMQAQRSLLELHVGGPQ